VHRQRSVLRSEAMQTHGVGIVYEELLAQFEQASRYHVIRRTTACSGEGKASGP